MRRRKALGNTGEGIMAITPFAYDAYAMALIVEGTRLRATNTNCKIDADFPK